MNTDRVKIAAQRVKAAAAKQAALSVVPTSDLLTMRAFIQATEDLADAFDDLVAATGTPFPWHLPEFAEAAAPAAAQLGMMLWSGLLMKMVGSGDCRRPNARLLQFGVGVGTRSDVLDILLSTPVPGEQ